MSNDKNKNYCTCCNIEFEIASNSDVYSGDVLLSTWVEYCPKCLYVNSSSVNISR